MPGWFPDAADPQDDEDYLFPEEVIKHDGDNPFAFTLPTIGEPTARQILGLPTPTKAKTKHKFTFLFGSSRIK